MKRARDIVGFAVELAALYMVVELAWRQTHDDGTTMREYVAERYSNWRERARERSEIRDTLKAIDDLPEW